MIKVLAAIVVPPHMSVSGGARAAELLSSALTSSCDVTVASMMGGDGLLASPQDRLPKRVEVKCWLPPLVPWSKLHGRYSTLFYRSNLPRIIRDGDFDIVHIHNPLPALEMERVARACMAKKISYVVSTHGFNEVANGGSVYGFGTLQRLAWQQLVVAPVSRVVANADGMFALSQADFDIVRNMGFAGEELSVVTNGVVVPDPITPDDAAAKLGSLGIPTASESAVPTFMFLGNHTPNKGLPVLLEAFDGLEDPFLLIVGGEKRPDVDYDRYTRNRAPQQKIVITGRLSDDEVAAAFARTDLFVFPTLADTFPLVVLEAMASATPVLATRVGGIPHQIDNATGELVEPGDVVGLRKAVEGLMRQPDKLAEMGRAAYQRASQEFSWAKAANDALRAYQRILSEEPSRRTDQQLSNVHQGLQASN